ncbi:hypothetical protein DPX16_17614 [Anabarilius grahami]|uniref:Uncharacterized protein n=1 Tax=Anabarilius grahami TaxID=495550 RepID=A0A3N0XZT6_ANAGA|nr:hypothetical protein DPX16_17614 [Anabarilius grahami]
MKYQKILEKERKNEDAQIDICESAQLRGSSNQTQGAIRGDAVPIIKRRLENSAVKLCTGFGGDARMVLCK